MKTDKQKENERRTRSGLKRVGDNIEDLEHERAENEMEFDKKDRKRDRADDDQGLEKLKPKVRREG